jgi:hypothetical protein
VPKKKIRSLDEKKLSEPGVVSKRLPVFDLVDTKIREPLPINKTAKADSDSEEMKN